LFRDPYTLQQVNAGWQGTCARNQSSGAAKTATGRKKQFVLKKRGCTLPPALEVIPGTAQNRQRAGKLTLLAGLARINLLWTEQRAAVACHDQYLLFQTLPHGDRPQRSAAAGSPAPGVFLGGMGRSP